MLGVWNHDFPGICLFFKLRHKLHIFFNSTNILMFQIYAYVRTRPLA